MYDDLEEQNQQLDDAPLLSSIEANEAATEQKSSSFFSKWFLYPMTDSIAWLANTCLLAFVLITTYIGGFIVEKLWY
jgi:hypothetical protein